MSFGGIAALIIRGPVETHGGGARGYNLYDGSLDHAEFASITTFGDGSVGVQLSKPFGRLVVHGDIRTTGGEGPSLVRGKVVSLKGHALSLKPGVKGAPSSCRDRSWRKTPPSRPTSSSRRRAAWS